MRAFLCLVLAAFSAFTAWVLIQTGSYLGFVYLALREPWGAQVLLDLCIAAGVVLLWMVRDARRLGLVVWPYALLVLTLGSIGILAYLIRRDAREPLLGPAVGPALSG